MWAKYMKIHRQEAVLRPDDFIYIYDMRPAVIMSQFPPPPSTTPLNATRPCNRTSAPDPLGRGQYENGTKHPLIVCCDGKYNAQRKGPATPSAQAYKACWDYVACDRFPLLAR